MEHFGTFDEFVAQMRAILDPTAAGKGYSTTGVDGQNALYEFVQDTAHGPGHALGEIIYKARRYGAKGDPVDVVKIASWAFLVWRHHTPQSGRAASHLRGGGIVSHAEIMREAAVCGCGHTMQEHLEGRGYNCKRCNCAQFASPSVAKCGCASCTGAIQHGAGVSD